MSKHITNMFGIPIENMGDTLIKNTSFGSSLNKAAVLNCNLYHH